MLKRLGIFCNFFIEPEALKKGLFLSFLISKLNYWPLKVTAQSVAKMRFPSESRRMDQQRRESRFLTAKKVQKWWQWIRIFWSGHREISQSPLWVRIPKTRGHLQCAVLVQRCKISWRCHREPPAHVIICQVDWRIGKSTQQDHLCH